MILRIATPNFAELTFFSHSPSISKVVKLQTSLIFTALFYLLWNVVPCFFFRAPGANVSRLFNGRRSFFFHSFSRDPFYYIPVNIVVLHSVKQLLQKFTM